MKRSLFLLLAMSWGALACNSAKPPLREQNSSRTEMSATPFGVHTEGVETTPMVAQPTQTPVSQFPEGSTAASDSGEIDVLQLTETDTDFLGVYQIVPQPYSDFIKAGGRVVNLEPMETFFALWVPDGYESMPSRRVMVIAHGHGGNAYRELNNELEFARKYGYAIVAIQWGEAEGERMFSGQQFYAFMNAALRYMEHAYNAQLDKCAYRGWSQGSGISYEVTYLDRINGTDYLRLTISHDGGMMLDASEMSVGREFVTNLYDGVYGLDAFEGKHFYLYAGEPGQAKYMRNTAEVITNLGGVVEQLIEDVNAGHDGFYRHPQYHEEALDIFFRLAP